MYLDLNQKIEYLFGSYKRFAKGEWHVTRQSREDVLILMLDGRLYFTEDGVESCVTEGEYYVQPAGKLQSALRPSDGAYYIYFHFKGSWCDGGINGLPIKGRFDIEKIYRAADSLCADSGERNLSRVSIDRAFCQIFESLLEDNRRSGESLMLAEKIRAYLSQNCDKDVDVGAVAEHFSYSPDYVIRVFKRAHGVTPHSYLTECRIARAKLLLSTTDKTAGQIAEECGYSDFTAFHRAFCARVGCSPGRWRKGAR